MPKLLPLTPQYRERVWGGRRLHPPQNGTPIGEAWIAYGESVVAGGPLAGHTLDQVMQDPEARAMLLGRAGEELGRESGFPLLIKLLDCADWLSVQVHPNDAQARQMVGVGERGKTEAWHMLEAAPGAEILAGVKAGTTQQALAAAIRSGKVLDVAERWPVQAGDTVFIPAGTLHALGPGLLLYEVQQSSDTTYRVYDWDRPASAGRALHLEESVAVTDPDLQGDIRRADETPGLLTISPYFELADIRLGTEGIARADTAGRSFHLVTVTAGQAELSTGTETLQLGTFQTALVAGATGTYELRASGSDMTALVARLPEHLGTK